MSPENDPATNVIKADFGGNAPAAAPSDELLDASDLERPVYTNIAQRSIEALLFASSEPVDEAVLEEQLDLTALEVAAHLSALKTLYQSRGVVLEQHGTTWAFRTASDVAEHLSIERLVEKKLSRAAIETLAIIAYHQPVTRPEIEEIRGVAVAKGTLDILLELEWIQPAGRRQTLGAPLQWATTDHFLDHFNLESLSTLPGIDELRAAGMLSKRGTLSSEELAKMGEDIEEEGVLDSEEDDGAELLDQN